LPQRILGCGAAKPATGALPVFILYQRDDCQLCDEALALLAQARFPAFDSVFIDGHPALELRYGARVPVLRDTGTDRELDWPFDAAALAACRQRER
jgi:hypothetical protein